MLTAAVFVCLRNSHRGDPSKKLGRKEYIRARHMLDVVEVYAVSIGEVPFSAALNGTNYESNLLDKELRKLLKEGPEPIVDWGKQYFDSGNTPVNELIPGFAMHLVPDELKPASNRWRLRIITDDFLAGGTNAWTLIPVYSKTGDRKFQILSSSEW